MANTVTINVAGGSMTVTESRPNVYEIRSKGITNGDAIHDATVSGIEWLVLELVAIGGCDIAAPKLREAIETALRFSTEGEP